MYYQERTLALPSMTLVCGDIEQICACLAIDGEQWRLRVEASADDRTVTIDSLAALSKAPLPNRICSVRIDLQDQNDTRVCLDLTHNGAKASLQSNDTVWLNACTCAIKMFAAERRSWHAWLFSRSFRVMVISIPFLISLGAFLTIALLRLADSELERIIPLAMLGYPWGVFGSILFSVLILSQVVDRLPQAWLCYTQIYLRRRPERSLPWELFVNLLASLIMLAITVMISILWNQLWHHLFL